MRKKTRKVATAIDEKVDKAPEKAKVKYSELGRAIDEKIRKLELHLTAVYGSAQQARFVIKTLSTELLREASNDLALSIACAKFVTKIPDDAATIAGLYLNHTLYGTLNPTAADVSKFEKNLAATPESETNIGENHLPNDEKVSLMSFDSLDDLSETQPAQSSGAMPVSPTIPRGLFGPKVSPALSQETAFESHVAPPIVVQTPVAQTPVAQSPVAPASVVQTPVVQTPVAQTPVAQTPIAQTPIAQSPVAQSPVAQTPIVQTPIVQTPIVQTPVAQTPVARAPVAPSPTTQTVSLWKPGDTQPPIPVSASDLATISSRAVHQLGAQNPANQNKTPII